MGPFENQPGRSILRFGKDTLLYIVSDASARLFTLLLIPLYIHYLGAAGYGALSLTDTVRSLVYGVFFNCVASIAVRFYPEFDAAERRRFFGTLWIFLVFLVTLLVCAFTLLGPWLFRMALRDLPYEPYGRYGILTALLGIATVSLPLNLFRAYRQSVRYATFSLGLSIASFLLVIYFVAVRSEGVVGSLKAQLYAVLALASIGVIMTWRRIDLAWSNIYLYRQIAFALPLVPHFLAAWGLSLSDRLVLNHYVSMEDLGVYTLGYQFGLLLNMVIGSIGNAWAPYYALTVKDPARHHEVSRLITYIWGVIMIMGLAVVLLTEPALQIVATPSFYLAIRLVPWIVAGYIFLGLGIVPRTILLIQDKTRHILYTTVVAVIVNMGLNLLLVPRLGIMAAAISTFVAYLFSFALSVIFVPKHDVIQIERLRVLKLVAICILIYGVGSFITCSSPITTAILRIVFMPLGILLGLWAVRFYNTSEVAAAQKIRSSLKDLVSQQLLS